VRTRARLLAVGLAAASSLAALAAEARAAGTHVCPAERTTVKTKTFSISSALAGLAIGPNGNVWFTAYDNDAIGRLTPRGKITYFTDGITANPEHSVQGAVGPRGITKGPDGNMWFTEHGADRIGRITPDGTITEFSAGITPPSGPAAADFRDAAPHSIVTGPDGNLWFTEQTADRIGRITPDGTITEFGAGITPSPNQALPGVHQYQLAQPGDITKGPDGNVWFVEQFASRVGRVTPDGVITEFPVPVDPPTFDNYGRESYRIVRVDTITAGPDGNVWFSEQAGGPPMAGNHQAKGAGAVGRITPSGEITQFSEQFKPGPPEIVEGLEPEPSPAGLRGIAKGADGNLWLLEMNGLVRMTPAGEVTELPAKFELDSIGDETMVAGPHSTFWFRDGHGRDITRITIGCSKR
jgi:streptogramin lyase